MRFSPRTFKIQWDLHAWSGVGASVLLFVIFYCGVFALFQEAFSRWQAPATAPPTFISEPSRVSYDRVLSHVERELTVPRGATIMLRLPSGPSIEPGVSTVSVYHEPSGLQRDFPVDRVTGEPATQSSEHSRLAEELYALHFFYQLPWGVELSGLVAVALFVALVSGVVIHWKDLIRQAWQFRSHLRLRVSSSDAHKVLGVFGLPFATMFAWSGAVLGMGAILSVPLQYIAYGGDLQAFDAARGYRPSPLVESGRPGPRLALDEIVAKGVVAANSHFAAAAPLHPERLDIELYADEGARFALSFTSRGFEAQPGVVLDRNGHVMHWSGDTSAPTESIDRVLFDLHFARFGGYLVKAFYALLSLGVCAVVVTGNLVWLARRDPGLAHAGNRILSKLTVGGCLGLVLSSAVYFVCNRLLPASLAQRADVEFRVFMVAWVCCIAVVFVGGSARAWARALCVAAALGFMGVVLSDAALRWAQIEAAFTGGSAPMLAAELVLLGLASICIGLARAARAQQHQPERAATSKLAARVSS